MKQRSLFTAIFIIIFLFTIISVTQAYGPGRWKDERPDRNRVRGPEQRNIDFCIDSLDLSSEQLAQFRKITEEHRDNMDKAVEGLAKYRAEIREQMQKGADADQKLSEDLLNQGAESWKAQEREMLRYRQQISDLLTQEQKDKLYMCENFRPKQQWKGQQGRPIHPGE